MKRRFFLLAAPAIVAAPSLMRVSTLPEQLHTFKERCLFAANPVCNATWYSGYESIDLKSADMLDWYGWDILRGTNSLTS